MPPKGKKKPQSQKSQKDDSVESIELHDTKQNERAFLSSVRADGVAAHVWKEDKQAGGAGWETVRDERKEKAELRFAKRALQAQQAKLKSLVGASLKTSSPVQTGGISWNVLMKDDKQEKQEKQEKKEKKSKKIVQVVEDVEILEDTYAPTSQKKKKPTKKKNVPQVSNEEELTKVVVEILTNDPHPSIDVAEVASRIQIITKKNWNQHFKKRYGTLISFIQNKSEFAVQDTSVYLAERFTAIKAVQDEKKAKKAAKKARREGKIFDAAPIAGGKPISSKKQAGSSSASVVSSPQPTQKAQSGRNGSNVSNGGNGSGLFGLLFLVLFVVIGTVVFLYVQRPDLFHQVVLSAQKFLKDLQKK